MRAKRENLRYLAGFPLSPELAITSSLQDAVISSEIVISVTPSEHLRATNTKVAPMLTADHILVSASKGIEEGTHLRMSEVLHSITSIPIATLGGPSFAKEVAAGLPTAAVVASADAKLAQRLQNEFSSESFRLYSNTDIIGVELGGALKNIIALAAGVAVGLNLGSNTAAALMTRGMAEMTRLAVACGAHQQTLAGLAGMGDLVLTCTGSLSRNRTVGVELGKGRQLTEIIDSLNGKVAEGVRCTSAALGLAEKHDVEMPITEQMNQILHYGKTPLEAIRTLMTRPGREE
jgi:glycerol-3-phosphate dehydrogenase (NAD(P)+)